MKQLNYLFFGFFILISSFAYSQGQNKIIQVTGLIVEGDSAFGIPGVYIYNPKTGRGTISNHVGYFSLPVLSGDSLAVKALGFHERGILIPADAVEKLSVIVQLTSDNTILPGVTIFPWPTEELFKAAFLALELPKEDESNMNKNLNEQVMKRIYYSMDASSNMNHKYYLSQQVSKTEKRTFVPTNPFLNPFAWAKFIQDVKKGGLKSRYPDEEDEDLD